MLIKDFTIEQADGSPVTIKIAPTPLVNLVECRGLFEPGASNTPEGIRALVHAIFWGARRAGSKITLEWLEMNVDAHNAPALFALFTELNQVKAKTNGTGAPGEARAAVSSMTTTESSPTS